MEEFIDVNPIGMTKLDNGLHVGFHRDAYDLVNACEVAKIGITEARKQEWKENLDLEGDINQESTADYITQEIDKKDEARDKLISFLFAMIRDYRLSPENDEAIAAEKLVLLIKPYSKLQRESLRRETDHIDGLITDLKKPENAALITTLRLTPIVTKLEAANTAFRNLFMQNVKKDRRSNLPTAAEVRPKTDAAYDRIIFMIRAAYLSGATPVDRAVIKTLIHDLNNLVDRTDTEYRQSLAQRKAAADKKPKEPKQPKEPKEPKTPKDPKPTPDPKQPEQPKKPDEKPKDPKKPGGDGNPDIHLPEE